MGRGDEYSDQDGGRMLSWSPEVTHCEPIWEGVRRVERVRAHPGNPRLSSVYVLVRAKGETGAAPLGPDETHAGHGLCGQGTAPLGGSAVTVHGR